MQTQYKDFPWSVVQFRCTQLPKLTVTVTSHHITTHIITLYFLLHFKFTVHLIATYVFYSFHLTYFILFFPPIFPPFFSLFLLPCTLSFSLSPTTKVVIYLLEQVHVQIPRAQKKKNGGVEKHPPKVGPLESVAHFFSFIMFSKEEGVVVGPQGQLPISSLIPVYNPP
jgi:hypothetical protein